MILIPEYIKKFRCIGSKCEDTCCKEWQVNIDKNAYKAYKKSNSSNMKSKFRSSIKINKGNRTARNYAKIIMNERGKCPFLDENNLCSLYKELGEKFLSDLCNNYPRITNFIDNKLEQGATTSCPEVARIVLFNRDGIRFENIDIDDSVFRFPKFINDISIKNIELNKYFWDIRMLSIYILQNRKYSLDERVILLGITYNKIQNALNNKNYELITEILENMIKLVDNMEIKDQLNKIPVNYQIQMRIIKEIADEKINEGISNEVYLQCVKETFIGIKYLNGNMMDDILNEYKNGCNLYYKKYIEEKEYVLENFMVNQFFISNLPIEDIWDHYINMVSMYSMIKFHLIGMGAYHKKLTDKLVLKLIYSFSRMILHNPNYIKRINNLIKKNNVDSLAHMCILVKN